MVYLFLAGAVFVFTITLKIFGVINEARRITTAAGDAHQVITAEARSDDEKERAAQRAALQMFGFLFSILLRPSGYQRKSTNGT